MTTSDYIRMGNDISTALMMAFMSILFARSARKWDRLMKEKYAEIYKLREAVAYWKLMYSRMFARRADEAMNKLFPYGSAGEAKHGRNLFLEGTSRESGEDGDPNG